MAVQVQLMFQVMMLLLWLFNFPSVIVEAQPIAKAGCHDQHCGRVKIPYPFGMDSSCYLEKSYKIDCNSGRPTIHVNGTNLEVTEISVGVARNTIRVNLPIIFENCNSRRKSNDEVVVDFVVHLGGSPFAFSGTENSFVAVGCNNLALLAKNETIYAGGCLSICDGNGKVASTAKSSCNGVNCCQTTIPSNLKFFGTSFIPFSPEMVDDKGDKGNTCKYAYLVEQNWLLDRLYHNSLGKPYYSVTDRKTVPAVLNWSIDSRLRSRLPVINDSRYKLSSCNDTPLTLSDDTNQTITQCFCLHGFRGNPYVSYGCDDVNECEEHTHDCYRKALECKNTYGSYECVMPEHNKSRGKMVVSGLGIGLGILVLVIGTWWSYKLFKRKRKEKLKKKYFKQNGGLLLQEQLSSGEVNVEKIKMFPSKELEKATDRYNVDRILGQGGQGTVYKGMLADGKIVAVKKSKLVDESQLRQFINEVVLLSQISHRNVVKLLGCCLETEVPLLVYEFIPNGTLFQFLHCPNEEFPLTWEMRLRIATEVAGALFYLHSAASIPIYHRDIKSTNILLDEKYRAIVADFGTSRSVTIDQTHVTTLVKGTLGYLDPEYLQSSQFTDKSDVYSFGVVLVELLTGQKAISSTRSEQEGRSLATYFLMAMESNCLFDIVDPQVLKQGNKEDVFTVASLAKSCLRLNGKVRPTMKEVTIVLGGIKKSENLIVQQEIQYDRNEVMGAPWDTASASTKSDLDICDPSSQYEKPLLNTY